MTIAEAIRMLASAGAEMYCKVCTVDAVDEQARTVDCSPLDESAPLLGVNLQANQECEEGVVMFPAQGSHVVVAFLSPATAVAVLCDKVEKMHVKIGDTVCEITAQGITINEGTNGGMVRVRELTGKLNALESDVNNLKTLLGGWIPVANDGGAALKTAVTSWTGKSLTPTQHGDLENTKVKH